MSCTSVRSGRALRNVSHQPRAAVMAARLPLSTSKSIRSAQLQVPRRSTHRAQASAVNVADYAAAPALQPTASGNTPESTAAHTARAAPLEAENSEVAIRQFFDAFNRRDLQGMADFVADDVEHCNLAYAKPYPKGKNAVLQFYKSFVDAVPRSAQFVIEDTTGTNASGTIGVIWHLDIKGTVVPNSSGVSFFRLNSQNRISYVRESPEHFTKITSVALPTLSVLSPLLSLAEPLIQGNSKKNDSQPQTAPSSPPSSYTSEAQPQQPSTPSSVAPAPHNSSNSVSAPADATTKQDRNRDVAMRPLIPSNDAKAAAAAASAASASTSTAVLEQFDEEHSSSVQSSRAPVLTSRVGADPRVHNGVVPTSQHPAPSVRGATSTIALEDPVDTAPEATGSSAAPLLLRFAGVWQKDQTKCDKRGYERALELMGLGGIQKATALGLEGMEVQFDEAAGVFETFFLTPVPFFKVRERYVLGGVETKQSRRDLRGGQQVAKAWLKGDRVVTELAWGPQQSGTGSEEFWVDENDQLNVKSTVTVNGQSSTTVQVYSRQEGGGVDSRYYAPKREIPFGIDPNSVSAGMLGKFLN